MVVRVLLCGTHPSQQNGYSRVVYELARRIAKRPDDVKLTIYGFQRSPNVNPNEAQRALPSNVVVHDAAAAENPRRAGFGEARIGAFLQLEPQDVVVIYNDLSVTSMLVDNLVAVHGSDRAKRPFKLVGYVDQVYLCQKRRYLDMLEREFDGIITFTSAWGDVLKAQMRASERLAWGVVEHGLDPQAHFPVTRRLARAYFGLDPAAFVVLNLNRNVPRKRYDHVMTAYAIAAAALEGDEQQATRPLRFLIGTDMHACWDLPEIFEREFVKRGGTLEAARKYLVGIANPQAMSDRDANVLHSVADVHVSAADGEGWGLCTFESAAVGVANVATAVGGVKDFLGGGEERACLVQPRWHFYVDNSRDQIGGETEVSDPQDVAAGILRYYRDEALRKRHGKLARRHLLTSPTYRWDRIADAFVDFVVARAPAPAPAPASSNVQGT